MHEALPGLGHLGHRHEFRTADASYALTVYDVDLSSDTRGLLKAGGAGSGQSVDVELGRNIALGESVHLTPRRIRLAGDSSTNTG